MRFVVLSAARLCSGCYSLMMPRAELIAGYISLQPSQKNVANRNYSKSISYTPAHIPANLKQQNAIPNLSFACLRRRKQCNTDQHASLYRRYQCICITGKCRRVTRWKKCVGPSPRPSDEVSRVSKTYGFGKLETNMLQHLPKPDTHAKLQPAQI
jgi:hypothetical protein